MGDWDLVEEDEEEERAIAIGIADAAATAAVVVATDRRNDAIPFLLQLFMPVTLPKQRDFITAFFYTQT